MLANSLQVRGTPASGKSMLAELLAQHIRQKEPAVHVIMIDAWLPDMVMAIGGWEYFLETTKRWVKSEETVFIFDEAQLSYEDTGLWNSFFKSMHIYDNRYAIIFASYGSPTSRINIKGTPIIIPDPQRVTLRPVDHGDDLPAVGLFFNRREFDDLVSKQYPSSQYHFHSSFFNALFDITNGHVGAIHDFTMVVIAHDVGSFVSTEAAI
jgi:hypothetical protein